MVRDGTMAGRAYLSQTEVSVRSEVLKYILDKLTLGSLVNILGNNELVREDHLRHGEAYAKKRITDLIVREHPYAGQVLARFSDSDLDFCVRQIGSPDGLETALTKTLNEIMWPGQKQIVILTTCQAAAAEYGLIRD